MNDLLNSSMQTYYDQSLLILNSLHFVRADWFYAFIPLLLFIFLSFKSDFNNKNWSAIVDRQLLPFVLSSTGAKQRRYPLLLVFIAGSLCITALAGPVYNKLPQPVYREQSALVILLDLSQSMNATDIKASRLSRAKLELLDLLKTRKTGQSALIVYAADAFVVTPLTDDNATIANMVPSLETDMMPAQGSNLSDALAKTFSLFTQAGVINGDILVITDDIRRGDEDAIRKVFSQGHRLSVFGIGTDAGAPIPLDGGFLQNSEGAIVIPKLEQARLQRYALNGGGMYVSLQADDSDTDKLSRLFESSEVSQDVGTRNLNADIWQEEGHWLLLPLIFFAAFWTRKGWLAVVTLFILSAISPISPPAYAGTGDDTKTYLDTQHLWSSPDQKAMQAFNSGDNKKAAENFTRSEWKASAFYRDGDYEAAAKTLENTDHSDGYYNRGNALAKLGKLEDAIKAYDKSLELDKNNDDASYNREQVKQALQKQQQDSSQQDGEPQDSESQDDESQNSQQQDNEQNKDNQNQQDQDQQSQDSEQQDLQQSDKQSDQQSDEQNNQNQQQQSAEEKASQEQEQLKQRDAQAEAEQQKQEDQQYQQQQQENQENPDSQKEQPEHPQQDAENKNSEVEHQDSKEKPMDVEINPMEASITEEEKATEQWLKRIPDDPGGLLRRKFYYQYKQIPNQTDTEEPW